MALGRYQLPKCLCLCRNHLNIPRGLKLKDPFIFYFNLALLTLRGCKVYSKTNRVAVKANTLICNGLLLL